MKLGLVSCTPLVVGERHEKIYMNLTGTLVDINLESYILIICLSVGGGTYMYLFCNV